MRILILSATTLLILAIILNISFPDNPNATYIFCAGFLAGSLMVLIENRVRR